MKIFLASDHAGFELKEKIEEFLKSKSYEVENLDPNSFDKDDDYPDFIYPAAKKVSENPGSRGIIFGKSGQGEAVVANKMSGIRTVVFYGGNDEIIKLSREHNDSNILSIGAGFVTEVEAKRVIEIWLITDFSGDERHIRRIEKIKKLEEK